MFTEVLDGCRGVWISGEQVGENEMCLRDAHICPVQQRMGSCAVSLFFLVRTSGVTYP